jgi:hypothetical protein
MGRAQRAEDIARVLLKTHAWIIESNSLINPKQPLSIVTPQDL